MGSTWRELFKLFDLIQSGDVRTFENYLTSSAIELNQILPCKGIGILHLAVGIEPVDKSIECTELILKRGGNPNLSNDDGVTPVHIAAIWGRVENLKLLIGCGGDPSIRDFDGHSAFDYAAREEQWDVFDYLQHVLDPIEGSFGSPCAYSLDLEKILVTTDQIVAEYEPINDQKTTTSFRKSEMVRDWCEKTSLVMNKLYPTILTETFIIDDDSPPWKSIDLKNITLDVSTNTNLNETNNTYKTCLSRKVTSNEVEISGIQHLQITSYESQCSKQNTLVNSEKNQRFSVYENFSLPGSPNSITHQNYNTKTNLKSNNQKSAELKCFTFDSSQSLFTNDQSNDFGQVLAVHQNKANEKLSSSNQSYTHRSSNIPTDDCFITDIKDCNTRRSSASSGVSSNFSGGSIVIANVSEEYKYEDKEEDVVLIEKRLLVSTVVLPVEQTSERLDMTTLSIASSLPSSVEYDNHTLRAELMKRGFRPGPIQDSTRTLYLKKLQSLKKNPIVTSGQGKTFSIELEKSLKTTDWMTNLSPYIELENRARSDFSNPTKKWREGTSKTSFTYLLLDPRVTANLPWKARNQSQHASWITFVNSIFYVGKGKRSRPYSHLYQALSLWKRDFKSSPDKKVQYILDIWSDKVGVVCLHIFQNVIPAEAFTYEAAMIDVLGLQNLKNLKCGNYYGAVQSWPLKERRKFGLYLLYKAMLIFMNEGERQLRPEDIE